MAITDFRGAESGLTNDLQGSGGSVNGSETTTVYTGTYSYRMNITTTAVGWISMGAVTSTGNPTTSSTASRGFNFWFRYGTKPASTSEEIMTIRQSTNDRFTIRLNSSGNLQFHDTTNITSNTPLATGTTTLNSGTWYRISGLVTLGAGTGSATIKIDGTTEYTSSSINTGSTNFTLAIFGKRTDRNGQSVDYYFDDISIDDSVEPASRRVIALAPTANSGSNQWTAGTGASDYQEVDERTHDGDDSYVQSTGAANDQAFFSFATISSAGFGGSTDVGALRISAYQREPSAVTSANQVGATSAASTQYTSTKNLPTTYDYTCYQQPVDWGRLLFWSETNADAVVGGVRETNAVAVRATAIYKEVLLADPPASTRKTFALLGVG